MKLSQATRQFQVVQRGFHNKILHTKTSDASGAFTALQLAHEQVLFCIRQVEQAQAGIRDSVNALESSIRCLLNLLQSSDKKNSPSSPVVLLGKAFLPVDQSDANQVRFLIEILFVCAYFIQFYITDVAEDCGCKTNLPHSTMEFIRSTSSGSPKRVYHDELEKEFLSSV